MARARVLSFMSTFGGPPRSPTEKSHRRDSPPPREAEDGAAPKAVSNAPPDSPLPMVNRQRVSSRPMSMVGGYQPPLMKIASDTIPELAPIFTFLNSHSNKLYQEGYFLRLNDLDSHGRPYPDRLWTECFAQLVGTVLSLWDASALDAAGEEGVVAPTFINLADASIKMIETLPTRSQDTQPLTNVLSVSTAGKNRYLFHFSTINALTQWTAGIRLAMFENASLQEAYTGSLIAGKGKTLNNIKTIMEKTRFKSEEWTRVRFGAGTPWRRCWCVISPADEKEMAAQKKATKKKSAYDRSAPILRGDIKFYDTRKIKKASPIATIRDAYSAYAIYPQSKPLIEQSTLIKIEGVITIHTNPEVTTEGFIFVMPEVRPAITGFEMMLRFLFPIYDTFAIYGRPSRLIADTLDTRSLMFAMPQEKRYGYLEIFDVATLIHTPGSQAWNEREWKKQLKQLTSQRIGKMSANRSRASSRVGSHYGGHRNSLPSRGAALRFQDGAPPMRSTPSLLQQESDPAAPMPPPHSESAPPGDGPFQSPRNSAHQRSASENMPSASPRRQRETAGYAPSRLSHEAARRPPSSDDEAPPPPAHVVPVAPAHHGSQVQRFDLEDHRERSSSESERMYSDALDHAAVRHPAPSGMVPSMPPSPVAAPPAFSRGPGAKPQTRPYQAPELRRANSRMSSTTLSQLAAAGNASSRAPASPADVAAAGAAAAWRNGPYNEGRYSEDSGNRGVNDYNNTGGNETTADSGLINKGLVLEETGTPLNAHQIQPASERSPSPSQHSFPFNSSDRYTNPPYALHAPQAGNTRSASPLSQAISVSDNGPSNHPPLPPTSAPLERPPASSNPNSYRGRPTSSSGKRVSIARKPVPSPSKVPDVPKPTIDTNTESAKFVMDEAAFSRVRTMKSIASAEDDSPGRNSGESSRYDPDSAVTPDYASTQDSIVPPLPTDAYKPRTGVLKTVGDLDPSEKEVIIGDGRYRPEDPKQKSLSDDWNIDFGPTQLYNPAVKAQTSDRPASADGKPVRRHSSELLGQQGKGRTSPAYVADGHSRSASRSNLVTPEPRLSRPTSTEPAERRKSLAWSPGQAVLGSNQASRQSITPEQFVQQRAAASRVTPVYAHNRQSSATPPLTHGRRDSRTPPLVSRTSSGDWTGQGGQQNMPARPNSAMLSSTHDYSAHLTAREQEHVARVTGSPLITRSAAPAAPPSGLIGAIEAREREKEELMAGIRSSVMVQQAIAQRQQQAQAQAQVQAQAQAQRAQRTQSQQFQQANQYAQMQGQYPTAAQNFSGPFNNQQQDYRRSYQAMPQQQQQQQQQQQRGHAQGYPQGYYQQPYQQQQQDQYQQYGYAPQATSQQQQQQQHGQYQQYTSPQGQYAANQGYYQSQSTGRGGQGGR